MKSVQIKYIYFIILFLCVGFTFAGPPAEGPPPPPLGPPPPPPIGVPIDGSILILVIAALSYGFFIMKYKTKKRAL
jgi:hypothetical protein